MSKLAKLIAQIEGFGLRGTIPTVRHNPGDLRHSPHSWHPADAPNTIGYIGNDADGWADLERQLKIYADRGLTLREMVAEYAPRADGANQPDKYIEFLCHGLGGFPADGLVADALKL